MVLTEKTILVHKYSISAIPRSVGDFAGREGGRRAGQREGKNLTSVRYLKELKRRSIHICYFFPAQQWLSHTSLDKQAKCQLINECVEWSKKDA